MNRCENCQINTPQKRCPLCGQEFEESFMPQIEYPSYKVTEKRKVDFIKKLFLFLTITAMLVTVFINIFTYSNQNGTWSVIVCSGLIFALLFYKIIRSKKINFGGKTLRIFFIASMLLICIDCNTGFTKWSTTYVIPFMTVFVAVMFTFIAIIKKRYFNEYFGYMLATAFISVYPIIIYVFKFSNQLWSSLVAALACIIISIGMFIFADQSLKSELKKRFHL